MKRKGTRSKIVRILAIGTALSMALSACQKNPDSSVVVNKDMDNLIEEAQNGENGTVNIGEAVGNYDTYQTQLSDESLQVSVNVDAKVDIPQTDQLSIIRVNQMTITQDLVDNVVSELMGNETLYDGAVTQIQSREAIEAEIKSIQDEMNNLTINETGWDEESLQTYINEYQSMIDSLQEEYENTPASIDWESYKSDGQLHSVQELYNRDMEDSFYSWEYSLNPNGDVLYAVTNEEVSERKHFYVQNNANYGNCMRYVKGNIDMTGPYVVAIQSSDLEQVNYGEDGMGYIWAAEEGPSASFLNAYEFESESDIKDVSSAPTTMPIEQAVDIADEFLSNVGIDGFEYYTGNIYGEACFYLDENNTDNVGYQNYYILQYMRNIDGAFVTFDSVAKSDEGWDGNDYVKNFWPVECIEFRINDDGIVGFYYNAPIETTETVVEQSAIKSFEEIQDTFEQMVLITNATSDEGVNVNIDIDRVVLGYARISEADSYDTGLLVPVWDFKGTFTNDANMTWYGSVLTINAIDGSIIDRSLGY